MERIAKIISWLFLPLLIPVYAIACVMLVPSEELSPLQQNSLFHLGNEQKLALLSLFSLFCFLAPSFVVVFLRMQGQLSSLMMENRKERYLPAFATVLSGAGLIYTIFSKIKPEMPGYVFIVGLAVGSLLTVLICTIATFRFKISLHAAGMGILTGFLMAYYSQMFVFPMWPIIIAFLLSGIVMSGRAVLKLHSQRELLSGYFVGFISVLGCCIYLYYNIQTQYYQ
jgi:hypothetical protein